MNDDDKTDSEYEGTDESDAPEPASKEQIAADLKKFKAEKLQLTETLAKYREQIAELEDADSWLAFGWGLLPFEDAWEAVKAVGRFELGEAAGHVFMALPAGKGVKLAKKGSQLVGGSKAAAQIVKLKKMIDQVQARTAYVDCMIDKLSEASGQVAP